MKTITINNMNDGINVKNDPSALSDGAVVDCVGFDLTKEGVLEVAKGLAANDLTGDLPDTVDNIEWLQIVYLGVKKYVLVTTTVGLYANGTLISSNFTGRFKAIPFLDNIFITNGTHAKRFDGTTAYQWGITAPTTVPTIAPGTYLSKDIDTFETLTTWIANQSSCTITTEATIKKEGSQSMHVQVAASTVGYSYVPNVCDLTTFTTGEAASEKDYIRFWLYVDNLTNLDNISIFIDIDDGTFLTNYFSYGVVSPGVGLQQFGVGSTADVIAEETTGGSSWTETVGGEQIGWIQSTDQSIGVLPQYSDVRTVVHQDALITKTVTKTLIDPVLSDQVLSFWRRSNLFKLKSATWMEIKIPKSLFLQHGDKELTWSSVAAVKMEVTASSSGTVNVYFDGLKLVGGSDLVGDYWFLYTWGRTDGNGIVLHESAPSRNNTTRQVNIIGPVTFDRQPLSYSARPLSSDAQVDCGVIYAIGGGLVDFWALAEVLDNTTAAASVSGVGESTVTRRLVCKNNEPAPAGSDMVLLYNKIWMVGDDTYPTVLRSSDILADGTVSPESWPVRNAYELDGNHGALNSIKILNQMLSVKGGFGEWMVVINDPTDFLQVSSKRVSETGLLGQDAVVELPTSNIYPTNGGFVESNGQQVTFILPEVEPIIDENISSAIGANAGLVSYFTFKSNLLGDRTAKVDLYRKSVRFSNLNNLLFDCLFYDKVSSTLYGVYNGEVFILDDGYTNASTASGELYAYIKSKTFRPGGAVGWTRVHFYHNTGGVWFRLEIYIDGALKNSFPFFSTTRTRGDFRFGPHAGYDLQFVITGDYKAFGKIYFPIGVYHSGQ